jgi:hypothetical protein
MKNIKNNPKKYIPQLLNKYLKSLAMFSNLIFYSNFRNFSVIHSLLDIPPISQSSNKEETRNRKCKNENSCLQESL